MTPDVFEEFLQPGQKPACGMVGISSWGPADLGAGAREDLPRQ
jgi:hypothetical protein